MRSLYAQAGQFDSAAWYGEQAATFFKTNESFLKAGNAYYEAYSFAMQPEKQKAMAEKAREWLGKAVDANPKNLEAKVKMAMTYVSSSTPMRGIQMMREVLTEDPKNEFALFNMGMLSIQSGQYARAIERLEELAQVNPNHLQGQMLLGVAYLNNGNKDKARQQFERVKKIRCRPGSASHCGFVSERVKVEFKFKQILTDSVSINYVQPARHNCRPKTKKALCQVVRKERSTKWPPTSARSV